MAWLSGKVTPDLNRGHTNNLDPYANTLLTTKDKMAPPNVSRYYLDVFQPV